MTARPKVFVDAGVLWDLRRAAAVVTEVLVYPPNDPKYQDIRCAIQSADAVLPRDMTRIGRKKWRVRTDALIWGRPGAGAKAMKKQKNKDRSGFTDAEILRIFKRQMLMKATVLEDFVHEHATSLGSHCTTTAHMHAMCASKAVREVTALVRFMLEKVPARN